MAQKDRVIWRWALALAGALVLHSLVLLCHPLPRHASQAVAALRVTLIKRVPTPRPRPLRPHRHHVRRLVLRPRPHHRVVRVVVHRQVAGAGAHLALQHHHPAHGAPRQVALRELARPTSAPSLPDAHATGSAAMSGRGTSSRASGATGTGSGGGNGGSGEGSGTGVAGKGSAAQDGLEACGMPFITPRGPIKTYGGLEHVHVSIQLELEDGTRTADELLPYPLLYRNDAESPFSARNMNDPTFPTLLQMPPPEIDPRTFSPLITYVLAHTDAKGLTHLNPCPSGK